MITFLVLCALMVVIALSFILPPLLQPNDKSSSKDESSRKDANLAVYRDQLAELESDLEHGLINQEQRDQDREELERRVLEDLSSTKQEEAKPSKRPVDGRGFVYALALSIPLVATALYLQIGHPSAMSLSPKSTRIASESSEEPTLPQGDEQRSQQDIEANVAALAKRLEENPDDLQGWIMLGRSYMSFEKYSDASAAYAKASALKPNDPDLLADYAYALAMANGRQLQGQPVELINKALKLDPENMKALELAGNAAFQANDYRRALGYWETLLRKLPPKSEVATRLSERIEEARAKAGSSK